MCFVQLVSQCIARQVARNIAQCNSALMLIVMPHVVNKAVEVQFKTKSAVVKEMLAPEIKGRDRAEAEAANKTTTGARASTRNGRQ